MCFDVPPGRATKRAHPASLQKLRLPHRVVAYPLRFAHALTALGYSFHAHMQALLSRKQSGMGLGALYGTRPHEYPQENSRAKNRRTGIASIIGSHQWANTVDLDALPAGFDSGE